jgi:hypothetical protein
MTHAAMAFARVGQTLPHIPQWVTVLFVSISHPLVGFMSQSRKPSRHIAIVHWPMLHPAVPLGGLHRVVHEPQCVGSARRSTSQPSSATPLQSA